MPLQPGTRLGPYEILSPLGSGGMGEVYRATDTNLKRQVAIKVLPQALAADPERLARFQREAETLAALNHPNIAHIHGLEKAGGTIALVMELVEGPTLADRIANGAIPLDEALAIAKQIAKGLEAAHEHGIIHRDLKPANIKVRDDGTAKILDFGLAKAMEPTGVMLRSLSESPTIMPPAMTQAGIILGTATYMAPEQARGKPVDKRADIWAFGVVLFEMLTGRKAFEGPDVSSILAAVIHAEPRWDLAPQRVRRLLKKCLEKDPTERLRDVGDAWELLNERAATGERPPSRSRFGIAASAVAALTTVALAAVSLVHFREKAPAPFALMRFEIPAPNKATIQKFAVSPDGRQIAYYAIGADGSGAVWIRSFDSVDARRVADTGPSPSITWSPDSRFIAFPGGEFLNKLMKVNVSGGPPQIICEIQGTLITGGSWNTNDVIIFGTFTGGVWRVSASGGTPSPLTTVDASRRERGTSTPVFLPDGVHFLYLRVSSVPKNSGIYLGSLDARPDQQASARLVTTSCSPVFAPSPDPSVGYLLFLREDALEAQPFDLIRLQLVGEPVSIADHVGSIFEFGNVGASTGVLAYRSGRATGTEEDPFQLTWVDRQGTNLGAAVAPGYYSSMGLSPNGEQVAVSLTHVDSGRVEQDIWLHELARRMTRRLTPDKAPDTSPTWSPDGTRVAYASVRPGGTGLYQKRSNDASGEETLLEPGGTRDLDDWSPDNQFLLYSQVDARTHSDLWVMPVNGDRKPAAYLNSEFNEGQGQFSPDGHWIAYVSDESGRPEVYVRPFPLAAGGGSQWPVSNGGGIMPRWRGDGRELFYLAASLRAVMATTVSDTPSFKTSVPESLFNATIVTNAPLGIANGLTWDVTANGKKFLLPTLAVQQNVPQAPMTIVLNWAALVKR